ncbi:MAG: hypothetical protein ABIH86_02865 [Planctomycetota bacterium]
MRSIYRIIIPVTALFASFCAGGQTAASESPAESVDSDRLAALEKQVVALSQSVVELKQRRTVVAETTTPAETIALRAENRRLKRVLETLSEKGVPWASLATAPDLALEKQLTAVGMLIDSYRLTVESDMDADEKAAALKDAEKKIIPFGAVGIAGIQRALANLPDTATEDGRRALELLLAIVSVRESIGIQAEVIDAQPAAGIIVLNKGLLDGLTPGRAITVIRDGQYIAQAIVDRAFSDVCRAKIAGDSKAVRIGDSAFSLRPLSIVLPDAEPAVEKK